MGYRNYNEYAFNLNTWNVKDIGHVEISGTINGEYQTQNACSPIPKDDCGIERAKVIKSLRQLSEGDLFRIDCHECRWLVTQALFLALQDGVQVSFR